MRLAPWPVACAAGLSSTGGVARRSDTTWQMSSGEDGRRVVQVTMQKAGYGLWERCFADEIPQHVHDKALAFSLRAESAAAPSAGRRVAARLKRVKIGAVHVGDEQARFRRLALQHPGIARGALDRIEHGAALTRQQRDPQLAGRGEGGGGRAAKVAEQRAMPLDLVARLWRRRALRQIEDNSIEAE